MAQNPDDDDDKTSKIPTALVRTLIAADDESTTKIPLGMVRDLLASHGLPSDGSAPASGVVPAPPRKRPERPTGPPPEPVPPDLAPLTDALIDIVAAAPPPSSQVEIVCLEESGEEVPYERPPSRKPDPTGPDLTDVEQFLRKRLDDAK